MDINIRPELKSFLPIAEGIANTVGKNCEVVIHDLQHPEESLVFMVGNITNRLLGSPVTNLVLEAIRSDGNESKDFISYQTKTKEGKTLKSSTMFIRDEFKKIIGCMCINIDITEFILMQKAVERFVEFPESKSNVDKDECFSKDVTDVIENIIDHVIGNSSIPVNLMQKEDKIQIVTILDKKGVFLVKGAIDQVAAELGVSRYTIYNYLEETRFKSSAD